MKQSYYGDTRHVLCQSKKSHILRADTIKYGITNILQYSASASIPPLMNKIITVEYQLHHLRFQPAASFYIDIGDH
jgi:hypothetical protein